MKIRVAINGFGRIGRMVMRAGINDPSIEFVAVNDLTDTKTLAHLFMYDSVQGMFAGAVEAKDGHFLINGKKIIALAERDPTKLPWRSLRVDVVVEATGLFRTKALAGQHLVAGAKKVVLTAPYKGDDTVKTLVMGVNEDTYDKKKNHIVSNASCTTNCLAPMAKVLNDAFKIKRGFMSTIHGYTSSQNLVDGPNKDLRRARAAAENIIPSSTGATEAVAETIPVLKGKLTGLAFRVPVVDGSITDFVVELNKAVTVEEVNRAFKKAAQGAFKGVIEYTDAPLVSRDIIGNQHSCIFDSSLTQVLGKGGRGNLVKVMGWYDNEWGYSNRMIDMVKVVMR